MENGVWRTVGGRRIFIKDGEDLATAMKNSGKFDKKGKTTDEDKRYNTKEQNELKRLAENTKQAQMEYEHAQDKYEHHKFDDNESESKQASRKAYEDAKDRLVKAQREEDEYRASKTIEENKNKYSAEYENYKKAHPNTDLTLNDYIKVKQGGVGGTPIKTSESSKETKQDALSKETKGYRHLNESNLGKGYEIEKVTDNGTYQVNYGNDEKKLLIHQDDTGYYVRNGDKKEYFDSNMNQKLEKSGVKGINDPKSTNEEKRIPGTKMKTTDEKDQKRAMYNAIQNDANRRYDKKEITREERNKIIDDAHDKYIKEKETKGNSQINDAIRRKAYQKYLKEHPNSKMKFEDFIK